jgi:catechol 2,3-dioxygenase-like lactoylglutathione lyase family enzyme
MVIRAAGHRRHGELGPDDEGNGREHTADATPGQRQNDPRKDLQDLGRRRVDAEWTSDDTKEPLMTALAEPTAIILDCADPQALAAFYRKITGWEITHSDEDSAYLGDGPIQLAFQRVAGYRGPGWPDAAKHSHLDFKVADPDAATRELLALGATKPEFQPGKGDWTVLADPEGHLFCIAAA